MRNRRLPFKSRRAVLFCEPCENVVVHLIDSGERERLNISEVFEMPSQLMKIPALAKNVAICGIKLSRSASHSPSGGGARNKAEIKSYFENLTAGGGKQCWRLHYGYPSRVDLFLPDESSSVSKLLIQKGFYDCVNFDSQKANQNDQAIELEQLKLNRNELYQVFMTHVADDGSFDLVLKGSDRNKQNGYFRNRGNSHKNRANVEKLFLTFVMDLHFYKLNAFLNFSNVFDFGHCFPALCNLYI